MAKVELRWTPSRRGRNLCRPFRRGRARRRPRRRCSVRWCGSERRPASGPGPGVLLARADETGLCPLIGVNGAINVYPLRPAATAGGWLETPRGLSPRLRQFALETVSDAAGAAPQAQSADRML